MAGKKKGPKAPKFQPSKYDWPSIEVEFLQGDFNSVAEFFRISHPTIPKKTWTKKGIGWGQKREAIRQAGSKIIAKSLAKNYADAVKNHLNWGAGLIKIGIDALVPSAAVDKEGKLINPGLKPESAGEAAKMVHLGTVIQKNAIQVSGMMEEMMKDKIILPDGEVTQPKNVVIIDIPSNTKEIQGT